MSVLVNIGNARAVENPIPIACYSTTGSFYSQPQFRYLFKLYESGSTGFEPITTLKAYPNLYGTATIDFANILKDNLDYDYNWRTTGSVSPVDTVKKFQFKGGYEYSDSISGSITQVFNVVGQDAVILPGLYTDPVAGPEVPQPYFNNIYTSHPQVIYPSASQNLPDTDILLNKQDYFTFTTSTAWSPPSIQVEWLTDNNTPVFSTVISGSLNRLNIFTTIGTLGNFYNTWGVGPKNLIDLNPSFESNFDAVNVDKVKITVPDTFGFSGDQYITYNLAGKDNDTECNQDYTRFAYINEYGFWDYYSIYNPLRRVTQVDRSFYDQTRIKYDKSLLPILPIGDLVDGNDRGKTQYRTQYKDTYEITTDYISSMTAEWLRRLFESPDVYIQDGNEFIPINITNTTIERNIDTARNKAFQYTIQFKYANDRQSR